MLKLVENKHDINHFIEVEENRNACFFDEIIAQVKYSHVEEIWHAQLKDLQDLVNLANQKKCLRAL